MPAPFVPLSSAVAYPLGGEMLEFGTFGIRVQGAPPKNPDFLEGYIKTILLRIFVDQGAGFVENTIPVCQPVGEGAQAFSAGRWQDAGGTSTAAGDFIINAVKNPLFVGGSPTDRAPVVGDIVKIRAEITQFNDTAFNGHNDVETDVEWTFTIVSSLTPPAVPLVVRVDAGVLPGDAVTARPLEGTRFMRGMGAGGWGNFGASDEVLP